VGLGKTHLAVALGLEACNAGYRVLYAPAIGGINDLQGAQASRQRRSILRHSLNVEVLILDEIRYLPIDKLGVDLSHHIKGQVIYLDDLK